MHTHALEQSRAKPVSAPPPAAAAAAAAAATTGEEEQHAQNNFAGILETKGGGDWSLMLLLLKLEIVKGDRLEQKSNGFLLVF